MQIPIACQFYKGLSDLMIDKVYDRKIIISTLILCSVLVKILSIYPSIAFIDSMEN